MNTYQKVFSNRNYDSFKLDSLSVPFHMIIIITLLDEMNTDFGNTHDIIKIGNIYKHL